MGAVTSGMLTLEHCGARVGCRTNHCDRGGERVLGGGHEDLARDTSATNDPEKVHGTAGQRRLRGQGSK